MKSVVASTNKGFSLIELMIVITIVALLAAIATPAYQNYMLSARAATVVLVMDSLAEKMIAYANINGHFPNAYDLGLSTTPNSHRVDSPGSLIQHIDTIELEDNSSPPCASSGFVWAGTNPGNTNSAWFSSLTSGGFLNFGCTLYNKNGSMNKKCFYGYADGQRSLTGNLIPGWGNYSTGSQYDYTNGNAFFNSSEYTSATCL